MVDLVTPPNGTTILSSSATYSTATINSLLIVENQGTVVTIQGATSDAGRIDVANGADLQLLGPFSGAILMEGYYPTLEVASGNSDVNFVSPQYGSNTFAIAPTLVIDGTLANVTMLGFYTGASIDFSSPAVSVSYAATGAEDDDSGAYEVGVLTVTESDNAVISIAMDGYSTIFSGNFAPNYVQANFTIVNGAVVYTTVVPPVAPVITGTAAGQAERGRCQRTAVRHRHRHRWERQCQ